MTMQTLSASQASPEIPINENFQTLEWAAIFGRRHPVTTGLIWGYYGGLWGGITVADGVLTLTNGSANYIVVNRATAALSVSVATADWLNTAQFLRLYKITTTGGVVTAQEDHRAGPFGACGVALPERRLVSLSAAYTFGLADMTAKFLHPGSDTTARTWTIDANAAVAFPIGAELPFINANGAGTLTIAITTDTMRLAGAGTTGSRTLAANGRAWAEKVAATEWLIHGFGLT